MGVAVIPSYEPNENLVQLVEDLHRPEIDEIIVVDDGSSAAYRPVFDQIKDKCTLLTHPLNMGKGAAIKTALRYLSHHLSQDTGMVFLEDDGKYSTEDALFLLEQCQRFTNILILGQRDFDVAMPGRFRWSNAISSRLVKWACGITIQDVQTGLRAAYSTQIPLLLNTPGDRYEYEASQIIYYTKNKRHVLEFPIRVDYKHAQKTTHYHTMGDSLRVFGTLAPNMGATILCLLLNILFFIGLYIGLSWLSLQETQTLLAASLAAFLLTAPLNYFMTRSLSSSRSTLRDGSSARRNRKELTRYLTAAPLMFLLSTAILWGLCYVGVHFAISKVLAEAVCLFINLMLYRRLVFLA